MKKILIIGGGAAGLSAGIYAQKSGYEALICEKQNIAGGGLSFWEREGHHIDNCIHWLIGTNKNTEMYRTWCELGVLGDADLYCKQRLYTSNSSGGSLSLDRDLDKLQNDMLSLSPRDEKEIRSLIKAVRTLEGYFGIAGKNHDERLSIEKPLFRLPNLLKYYPLSLEDLAARFHHPVIKDFIVSFMPAKFASLALIFTMVNFCGANADLPIGGSAYVKERLEENFLSLGGKIEYGKEAVAVKTKGRKVVSVSFLDGSEYSADEYIFTIDPALLFGRMIDCPMPAGLASQYKKRKRFSAVQCAFECDLPTLPFEGEETLEIPEDLRVVLPGHHVNLRYEGHEKSYSPKGKTLLQAMIYCNEEAAVSYIEAKHHSKEAYQKQKEEIAECISALTVKQFPFLAGKLRAIDVWTPATYQRYLGTEVGSFMSFAFPKSSIPRELSNRAASFNHLYLAGQWLQMPGGLPIAVTSGKKAILRIVKQDRIRKQTKTEKRP